MDNALNTETKLPNGKYGNKIVRLIADDDLFYSYHYRTSIGRNMFFEGNNAKKLEKEGLQISFSPRGKKSIPGK